MAFCPKGRNQENSAPTPDCAAPHLPAPPHARPSELVTKEKPAATLMQLGKCYLSNAARSSGLSL